MARLTEFPKDGKVIIAGSRTIHDLREIEAAVNDSGWRSRIGTVISGTAYGADRLGEIWAASALKRLERFPADWEKYGRAAGFRRNLQMAQAADGLIAVWDGSSSGTRHMINTMEKLGKPVWVRIVCD